MKPVVLNPNDSKTPLYLQLYGYIKGEITCGNMPAGEKLPSLRKLAKDLGIAQTDAAEYIEAYFRHYADVKEYMEENVRKAKADGYVTTILGRKRYIPELKSSNFNLRAFGERAAMNMPLQGSSADIIKLAMVNVAKRLGKEGLRAKMIMQVHDELVLDAPREEAETAAALLREEMEGAVRLRVPLTAEVSTGVSWYDAK